MWARAAFAAALAAVLALALPPGPLRRLAGGDGDRRDPRFDVALDAGPLRREGERLPRETPYFVSAPRRSPLVQGNLKAASQLYLARALPVQDSSRAQIGVCLRDGRAVVCALR